MKGLSVIVVLASAVAMAGALPTAQVSKYTLPTKQMCLNRFSNTDKDHRVLVHASCLQYGILSGDAHTSGLSERAMVIRHNGPVLTDLVNVAVSGNVTNNYNQCSGGSPVLSGAVNVAIGGHIVNDYGKGGDGLLDGLVNIGVLGGTVTNNYDAAPDCSSSGLAPASPSEAAPVPSTTAVGSASSASAPVASSVSSASISVVSSASD